MTFIHNSHNQTIINKEELLQLLHELQPELWEMGYISLHCEIAIEELQVLNPTLARLADLLKLIVPPYDTTETTQLNNTVLQLRDSSSSSVSKKKFMLRTNGAICDPII